MTMNDRFYCLVDDSKSEPIYYLVVSIQSILAQNTYRFRDERPKLLLPRLRHHLGCSESSTAIHLSTNGNNDEENIRIILTRVTNLFVA